MSCLAKCYSNEKFSFLWAARSRFDNTGSATLSDYRVRFRIAGFSAWSPWHNTSKVYPGQVVVDPYYPVFDFDKLSGVTGPRPAMLETEYEYRRPNGEKVTESDSRRLEVLGYNQTIFSGLPISEIMNFADRLEYMPPVLASFTTPNDPVIQELAGRVSGRADGAAAAFHNADAVKFLRSLYETLADNACGLSVSPVVRERRPVRPAHQIWSRRTAKPRRNVHRPGHPVGQHVRSGRSAADARRDSGSLLPGRLLAGRAARRGRSNGSGQVQFRQGTRDRQPGTAAGSAGRIDPG